MTKSRAAVAVVYGARAGVGGLGAGCGSSPGRPGAGAGSASSESMIGDTSFAGDGAAVFGIGSG